MPEFETFSGPVQDCPPNKKAASEVLTEKELMCRNQDKLKDRKEEAHAREEQIHRDMKEIDEKTEAILRGKESAVLDLPEGGRITISVLRPEKDEMFAKEIQIDVYDVLILDGAGPQWDRYVSNMSILIQGDALNVKSNFEYRGEKEEREGQPRDRAAENLERLEEKRHPERPLPVREEFFLTASQPSSYEDIIFYTQNTLKLLGAINEGTAREVK